MASSSASPATAGDSQTPLEQTPQQTSTTPQTEEKTQDTVPTPVSTETPKPEPTLQQSKQSANDDSDDESDFDELDGELPDRTQLNNQQFSVSKSDQITNMIIHRGSR